MVYYDYINIGFIDNDNDNDNDNKNDNNNKRGIIIDQNKENLDKITNIKNCIKLNMCISDYDGKCNITTEKGIFEVYAQTLYQIMINFNIKFVNLDDLPTQNTTSFHSSNHAIHHSNTNRIN
jgi:hypothetical protein